MLVSNAYWYHKGYIFLFNHILHSSFFNRIICTIYRFYLNNRNLCISIENYCFEALYLYLRYIMCKFIQFENIKNRKGFFRYRASIQYYLANIFFDRHIFPRRLATIQNWNFCRIFCMYLYQNKLHIH